MEIDWVGINFTKQELIMLQKFCYSRRFCNRHMQKESILSGIPNNEIKDYKKALDNLIKKGIIAKYKTQNRYDLCFPHKNYAPSIEVLRKYESEYDFIDTSDFAIR